MRKDLIVAACVGILGMTSIATTGFAGEKEFFTEEDIQDTYRMVDVLPIAPDLGNITRANVWIKEADNRAKAKKRAQKPSIAITGQVVMAKAPAPKSKLTAEEPKLLPPIVQSPVPTSGKTAENYKVQKGDTLFGIVEKLEYKNIDKTRTAVALWQSNKDSFIAGNLNGIIPGKILELNEVAKNIEGIDSKTAKGILKSQWQEWKNRSEKVAGENTETVTEETKTVADNSTGEKRVAEKAPNAEKTPAESTDTKTKEDDKPITVSNLIKN